MTTQIGVFQQVHPLEHLIGGTLQAIVRADGLAAQSSLQFFEEVGFEDGEDKQPPSLRMIEFTYTHPVPDPANPGTVIDTPTIVKVPLISMLSIPNLTISETSIDFNVKVVGFTPIEKNELSKHHITQLPFLIQSVFASKPSAIVSPSGMIVPVGGEPSTISISIRLKKEVIPETKKRITALLDDAIISRTIREETKGEQVKETLKKSKQTKSKV